MVKMAVIAGMHQNDFKIKVLEKLQSCEMQVPQLVEFVQQLEQVSAFTSSNHRVSEYPSEVHHATSSQSNRLNEEAH